MHTHVFALVPIHVNVQAHTACMHIVYTLAHTSIHTVIIWHAASAAMVVMVIRLAHRVCWRSTLMAITDGGQYWRALKQLLPLVAFPILFFIFVLPVVMYDEAIVRTSDEAQALIPTFLIPLWSMASGVTLIVHIAVALLCTCNKKTAARWSVNRCGKTRVTRTWLVYWRPTKQMRTVLLTLSLP